MVWEDGAWREPFAPTLVIDEADHVSVATWDARVALKMGFASVAFFHFCNRMRGDVMAEQRERCVLAEYRPDYEQISHVLADKWLASPTLHHGTSGVDNVRSGAVLALADR